ncbi:hypothetical protein [Mesorhizobium sp. CO1-1-8]
MYRRKPQCSECPFAQSQRQCCVPGKGPGTMAVDGNNPPGTH